VGKLILPAKKKFEYGNEDFGQRRETVTRNKLDINNTEELSFKTNRTGNTSIRLRFELEREAILGGSASRKKTQSG
jgi:hypothetical protein